VKKGVAGVVYYWTGTNYCPK